MIRRTRRADGGPSWRAYLPRLALVLAAGLLLRLPLMLQPGYRPDLWLFREWGWEIRDFGLAAAYDLGDANYPPAYLYVLGLLAHAGEARHLPRPGDYPQLDRSVVFLLKTPALLADLLLGSAVFFAAYCWGKPERSVAATAAVTLNPALVYATAFWGQIDSVHTLLMLAAVLAALAPRPGLAGGCLALAVLTKFQSIVMVPLAGLLILPSGATGLLRAFAAGLAVGAVVLGPFAIAGKLGAVLNVYLGSVEKWSSATVSADNLWYLAVRLRGDLRPLYAIDDQQVILGSLTYRHAGLLLFAAWTVFITVSWLRRRQLWATWVSAAALAFGMFCLTTQMHDRYAYPAVVFLAVVAWRDARLLGLLAVLSTTLLLNLMEVVPPAPVFADVARALEPWPQCVISAANVAALLAMGAWLWLPQSGEADREAGPHSLAVFEGDGGLDGSNTDIV